MTIDNVRECLERYRSTVELIERKAELKEVVYAAATGGAGGGADGDIVGTSVVVMDSLDTQIEKLKRTADKQRHEIVQMCQCIPDALTKQVMLMTYILGHDRAYIADELRISKQSVTYRRRSGLETIARSKGHMN